MFYDFKLYFFIFDDKIYIVHILEKETIQGIRLIAMFHYLFFVLIYSNNNINTVLLCKQWGIDNSNDMRI